MIAFRMANRLHYMGQLAPPQEPVRIVTPVPSYKGCCTLLCLLENILRRKDASLHHIYRKHQYVNLQIEI